MASESDKVSKSRDKNKKLTQEQIVCTFNQLRQDQKNLITKLNDLEQELNEHSLVADALKDVDKDRVCYRMIGGVLVQRTVKEVLPAVLNNKEQLAKVIESLNQKVEKKGKELNEFKEKYNIQIRKEPSMVASPLPDKEPQSTSNSMLVETKST